MLGNAGGGMAGAGQGGLGGLLGVQAQPAVSVPDRAIHPGGHGWGDQFMDRKRPKSADRAARSWRRSRPETVGQLSQQTGMGSSDLLSQLSQLLPGVINQLTPQGRMPIEQEHAHW